MHSFWFCSVDSYWKANITEAEGWGLLCRRNSKSIRVVKWNNQVIYSAFQFVYSSELSFWWGMWECFIQQNLWVMTTWSWERECWVLFFNCFLTLLITCIHIILIIRWTSWWRSQERNIINKDGTRGSTVSFSSNSLCELTDFECISVYFTQGEKCMRWNNF